MLKYFLLLLSVPMLAADVSDAVVTFSDGSKVSGRLTVMGSRPITINQQKDKRSRDRNRRRSPEMFCGNSHSAWFTCLNKRSFYNNRFQSQMQVRRL